MPYGTSTTTMRQDEEIRFYIYIVLSPYVNEMRLLTGNCVKMSKEMLECTYKFRVSSCVEQQRRGSRQMPQCDVTVRKTCRDDTKKIYYFYNICVNL